MNGRRSADGFTLLEVLVAFSIMSLSLGVLIQIFGTGLRSTARAEEYTLATLHAESLLARLGSEQPLDVGETGGDIDDRFRWQARVEEFFFEDNPSSLGVIDPRQDAADEAAGDDDVGDDNLADANNLAGGGIAAQPYRVVLTVFWDDERSVSLETLRLVPDADF